MTITGTAAQINAALAGLSYTGNLNFNGPDTLTVTTGDGTAQDIDTVAITVNPVNDAPVNTVPGAQSVNEDTTLPIAGVSVADVDSSPLTTTLTVSSGTLNVTGGGATIGGNGTAAVTIGHAARSTRRSPASPTPATSTSTVPTRSPSPPATAPRGHRHGRHHRQPGERCAGQHGAGSAGVNEDTALPIAGVSVADVDGTPLTTTLTVTAAR